LGRVAALSAPVTYELTDDKLVISFPKDFTGKKLVGEAVLYCPSDENKYIKKNFSVQDEPLSIPLGQGKTGMYELQLSWKEGTVSYYFEKRIFI